MISSTSAPNCNRSHSRRSQWQKNNHFLDGYSFYTPLCASLVERRGSGLELLKSTFNAKNYICMLSWSISSHFGAIHSWNVTMSQPQIAKRITKTLIFEVQGHSTLSMLTPLRSSSPVLVMISSMSVLICNHFHARQANSGKITFLEVCPSFSLSSEGIPFTQRHEILYQNTIWRL